MSLPKSTKQGKTPHCQCSPDCSEPPLANSPFCKTHQTCSRKSPLTGFEPAYDPAKYNKHPGIKESHNCYTYALNYLNLPKGKNCNKNNCPLPFPQPGRASGYPQWSDVKGKRCPDLIARLMGDVPGSSLSTFEAKCPAKTRKIAIVVDKHNDYHLFRQDSNRYWSHKPGATDVISYDATKRRIYDPELASRYYPKSDLNYDQFCSYICIPSTTQHRLKRGGSKRAKRTKTKSKRTKRTKTKKTKKPVRLSSLMV